MFQNNEGIFCQCNLQHFYTHTKKIIFGLVSSKFTTTSRWLDSDWILHDIVFIELGVEWISSEFMEVGCIKHNVKQLAYPEQGQ